MLKPFRSPAWWAYALASVAVVIALVFGDGSFVLAAVAVGILIVGAVLLALAERRILGQARVIAGAAREIGDGRLETRIDIATEDELGRVAVEFNRMATSLEVRVAEASQERNLLMAAINSSIDAVIAVDQRNHVAFANEAVQAMLGRSPTEVMGQPFAWLISTPDVIHGLRDSRDNGVRSSHVIDRPGRRYLRAIITPIRGGGDWQSLVVFHDLTDVRRVEEVRRDFVANVSHELRTPLAAVKSVIETLEGGALEDEAVARDFLSRADSEVDRLVQLVEELLELSRIESGDLKLSREPLEIGSVVTIAVDRLRPQAEKARASLGVSVDERLPLVPGDFSSLERVVVNLVHNAIKFTPEGGRIDVEVRPAADGVTITVRDSGPGIETQDLPRVFERFYKADRARRAGGTGLGLAVVKHTVEAHGGTVEVESDLGSGATFRVWLPVASPARSAADAAWSGVGDG